MRLSRRHLVQGAGAVGLGLLAACGRLPGQAQPGRLPRIGILVPNPGPTPEARVALQEGLHELGYVEGQNLAIEWRWAAERGSKDLDALAAELVGLQVDLILTFTTPGALAAKRATSSIPIVFTTVSDPVGSGLAASLGRPGGNATGLSDFGAMLSGKRLELLRDTVPGTRRVGFVWPAGNPAYALLWHETQAVAPSLGVQLISLEFTAEGSVDSAFEAAVREQVEALIVLGGPHIGERAAARAADLRLPVLTEQTSGTRAGGLLAYGPNRPDLHRRAAYYVDRILRGANPADLPVEQPREFEFVINLKTAQALGLAIPPPRAAPGDRGAPVVTRAPGLKLPV